MAQDGFSTAAPRPSTRTGRSGGSQGAPQSARTAPVGSSSLRSAQTPLSPPGTRPSVSGGAGAVARLGAAGGSGPATAAAGSAVRPADDDDVLTVDELVAWLRLSESTVLKLLSERAIPARKVGHQWRVRRGRVRDWLDGRE
ncbi:helix-turn-helix domain-containing protein [Candidatus Frankia alpina]|uniref:helix-turn-helix domain-containing protein n=1 Tax=Candidatus Frankia alpina TaxID=2699483 RepID=UPI001F2B5DD6|nr:helix-turn-helix domain-containing protein [Candidatus Frankia alpina]